MNKFTYISQAYDLILKFIREAGITDDYKIAWIYYSLGRGTEIPVFMSELVTLLRPYIKNRSCYSVAYSLDFVAKLIIKNYNE